MSTADRRSRIADVPAALIAAVDRDARRVSVAGAEAPDPTGIDFVEVVPMALNMEVLGRVRLPKWRTLLVHFLRGPVPDTWDGRRVAIVGGVRADPALNPVEVAWAVPAVAITGPDGGPVPSLPPGVSPADRTLVRAVIDAERRDRVLVVRTTTWGDLSGYVLRILAPDGESLPPELDPPLAQDRFTFAIDCPATLDCRRPEPPPPAGGPQPVLDYLARDYPALRERLLDRVSSLVPGWQDTTGADIGVTLLELMAHLGDLYAYRQDAAAVEAYLTTARLRTSVRRHARLLGYPMGDGCAARTWLAFTVTDPAELKADSAVGDGGVVPAPPGSRTPLEAVDAGATVFETTRDIALRPARNQIPLHPWDDRSHSLPAGATAAYLAVPAGADPVLRAGDIVVLAELPPGGADEPQHGDPGHRQAVRLARDPVAVPDPYAPGTTVLEIRWSSEDALRQPLVVSEPGPTGRPVARAVALANVVLADAGATIRQETLDQVGPVAGDSTGHSAAYRPRLDRPGVVFVDAVDPLSGPAAGAASARGAVLPAPGAARAAVLLDDGRRDWVVRGDLLASSGLDAHLVVEVDDEQVAWLRFGDGTHGRRPSTGTVFRAVYRVGSGAAGNVAAGTLTEPLLRPDGGSAFALEGTRVWNPLPATGGADPEPVAAVQHLAPQYFHRQRRAVTADDHRVVAEQVSGVQRAVARRRWTGSWHAVEVLVDPLQDRSGDASLTQAVRDHLEVRRMAASDVEVRRPLWVPVHVRLTGCVHAGYRASEVVAQIRARLSAGMLPDGSRGVFHPDNLTFGQPLRLSDVVAAAMEVAGISWIEVTDLRRLGGTDTENAANLAAGVLRVGPREVIRCESDPNLPEFGRVDLEIGGGP